MSRTIYVWAVLALLIGLAARVYRLGDANLWYDEGWSVFMARQAPAALLDETARDVHPPLYFLILSAWRALGGESEFMLRFPSAAFGLLLIAVGFRLTRTWFGSTAAVLAAGLLAVQGAGIWYSQEIRMYALTMLLALLALGWAAELVATGRWRAWVALSLTVAIGLHSLYLFVLVPVALSLAVLGVLVMPGQVDRQRLATRWMTAMLAAGALFAPWLLYAAARRPERFAEGGVADLGGMPALWLNTLLIGNAVNINAYWPVYLAALGLVAGAVALWAAGRTDGRTNRQTDRQTDGQTVGPSVRLSVRPSVRPAVRLFVLLAALDGILVSLVLVWSLSLPFDLQFNFVPTARYLITLVPWATIGLAVALAVWQARWRRVGTVLGALSVGALAVFASGRYTDRYLGDTYRAVAETWRAYRQPGDGLLVHNDREWPQIDYYLGGEWHANVPNALIVGDAQTAGRLAEPTWTEHEATWLLVTRESLLNDFERRVWHWLDERALASRSFDYGPYSQLWVFARTPERAASLDQVQVTPDYSLDTPVAGDLRWVGLDRSLPEAQVGDAVQVVTYWNGAAPTETPLGLRLTSIWGGVADEIPIRPPAGTGLRRLDTALPIRPYVGPGWYRLELTGGPGGPVIGPSLGILRVLAAPLPPAGSPLPEATQDRFDNGLTLRGVRLTQTGDQLLVELNYAVTRVIDQRWKRFVHLTGPDGDGRRWTQIDDEPLQADPALTAWPLEQLVRDQVTLTLPPDLPPGDYTVSTGFYNPLTGERLTVITAEGVPVGDRLILGTLSLR